jgi:aspartyl-tRNA(Asn)/glutamyl-tRNA(Gln) amidotransferase subunit C
MTEAMNVYREDVVQGSMPKAEALRNAPFADDHYFKVPKVIKNPSGTTGTKEQHI